MTKEDYDYIESTLRELSLFVRERKEEEPWRTNEKDKAQFKRLFYVVDSLSSNELKIRKEEQKLFNLNSASMRSTNVVSKMNREKHGMTEFFNNKEIKSMPKLKELSYRYKEKDGIHEFRYRRNGLIKSFSSKNFKEAKRKALEFCKQLNEHENFICSSDINFIKFSETYLQNVKKQNVTEKTFFNDYNRYTNYIIPAFKSYSLNQIKAFHIQQFLNDILSKGHKRTAEALFYILKSIFDYAVNTDLIDKNPIKAVKIPMHERTTGKALPIDVEKSFVKSIAGTPYELAFIISLYTGCRPCELESLCFEKDGFITFRNRKQKRNMIVYKDIPITPMLKPYVERIKSSMPLKLTTELTKIFNKYVPKYRLYDLRHTFATRCQTCGVPQEIVGRWLGHKSGRITDNTYTHFPPDFMLKMAKKVDY